MNPVDWREWGSDAFEDARRRNVPIFLSVGYSTCYWCHVMERECFESQTIADEMNRDFVCIKVDREQRPDIDEIYMAAVQAFTSRGGWPMSVFLEPRTLKPFWAGTYFPPTKKFTNVPSFPDVLGSIALAWREQHSQVLLQSESLAQAAIERVRAHEPPRTLSSATVQRAVVQLVKLHDRVHGGFGPAPKFPQPVFLELLLDVRQAAADQSTREAMDSVLRQALDAMALGGIFDHVGGGFHRYSVDERWLVPHFEKMLYDNAQLLSVYARASHLFSDPFYAHVAQRIVEYVLRDLRLPASSPASGAFYAAQDAEAEAREGAGYVWTPELLAGGLPAIDAEFAARIYGVTPDGNFRDPHDPAAKPASVLHLSRRPELLARELSIGPDDLHARIARINQTLLRDRQRRPFPATDTKVLASWNAMMILGLVHAATLSGDARALPAARAAMDTLLEHVIGPDASLRRCLTITDSDTLVAHTPAMLEDFAHIIRALVALAKASPEDRSRYLALARQLASAAWARFADSDIGLVDSPPEHDELFVKPRSIHDGAIPSATSTMLLALLDLSEADADSISTSQAAGLLALNSGIIDRHPLACAGAVRALLRMLQSGRNDLHAALAGRRAHAGASLDSEYAEPVEVLAEGDHVVVAPGLPASMSLRVRVAPGYHLIAADPGDSPLARSMHPLRVHLTSPVEGLSIYADYPPGEPLGDGENRVLINSGEFDVVVAIEAQQALLTSSSLSITFQACTDSSCLEVRTLPLDIEINSPAQAATRGEEGAS